jgi:hypothetical protein
MIFLDPVSSRGETTFLWEDSSRGGAILVLLGQKMISRHSVNRHFELSV